MDVQTSRVGRFNLWGNGHARVNARAHHVPSVAMSTPELVARFGEKALRECAKVGNGQKQIITMARRLLFAADFCF